MTALIEYTRALLPSSCTRCWSPLQRDERRQKQTICTVCRCFRAHPPLRLVA
jgi:hypothetical protein